MSPTRTLLPRATSRTGEDDDKRSSSLYLFTFLTTLFVLLAVSLGIALRTYVLRRRLRRRVEEALANGTLLPAHVQEAFGLAPRPRYIGEKPKIHDVFLGGGRVAGLEDWSHLRPVAASVFDRDAPPPAPDTAPRYVRGRYPGDSWTVDNIPLPRWIARRLVRERPPSPLPQPLRSMQEEHMRQQELEQEQERERQQQQQVPPVLTPLTIGGQPDTTDEPKQSLQVAVLIALPSPTSPAYDDYVACANSDAKTREELHARRLSSLSSGSTDVKGKSPSVAHRSSAFYSYKVLDEDEDDETPIPEVVFGVVNQPISAEEAEAVGVKSMPNSPATSYVASPRFQLPMNNWLPMDRVVRV